jgi:hypothetical protein
MPYAYAAAGVLTSMTLQSRLGALSGGTLIAAGVITWLMRYSRRRAKKPQRVQSDLVRVVKPAPSTGSYYNDPG